MIDIKNEFLNKLKAFSKELTEYVLEVPLTEFLEFKGMSLDKINPMKPKPRNKK